MKKGVVVVLFFVSLFSAAQNRNSIWCFGDSAGIDFRNTANPTPYTSAIRSRGSCISMSDTLGQLLFTAHTRYGVSGNTTRVKNRNLGVMQNGNNIVGEGWYDELTAIPYPGHPDLFLLFSISVTGSSQLGLYYSIIDMSLNAGLGDVTQSNVQLLPYRAKDGIKAVKHGNGNDWWIIFRQWDSIPSNQFHVFLVDSFGVHPPIVQNVGSLSDGYLDDIVFTQDGSRFYITNNGGFLERYNFDRCTGMILEPFNISPEGSWSGYWGIALSKNDSVLYVSSIYESNHGYVYQFDLTAPNILASRDTIYHFNIQTACGAMRLAPDDKIYLTIPYWYSTSGSLYYDSADYGTINMNLSVINSPNVLGAGCNFTPISFYLGGHRTYWGLPNNPDYEMGPLTSSFCDTITTSTNQSYIFNYPLSIFPNPTTSNSQLTFTYPSSGSGREIVVNDINGKEMERYVLPMWSSRQIVKLPEMARGVYVARVIGGVPTMNAKFVVE
jgi:hypothetical protein